MLSRGFLSRQSRAYRRPVRSVVSVVCYSCKTRVRSASSTDRQRVVSTPRVLDPKGSVSGAIRRAWYPRKHVRDPYTSVEEVRKTRTGCGNRVQTGWGRIVSATRRDGKRVSNAATPRKPTGDHVAADVVLAPSPRWQPSARDRAKRTRGLLSNRFSRLRPARECARTGTAVVTSEEGFVHLRNYRGKFASFLFFFFLYGLPAFSIAKDISSDLP